MTHHIRRPLGTRTPARTGGEDRPAWQDSALCAQSDPDAWYPSAETDEQKTGVGPAKVKALCDICPVRAECLAAALENDEQHGIWGGTTPQERRKMKWGAA